MNITVSPTFTQEFSFAPEAEGCGCCGFFMFRRSGEYVLGKDERLVRVRKGTKEQRHLTTAWLEERIADEIKLIGEKNVDPALDSIRQRAATLLSSTTPITKEGLEKLDDVIREVMGGIMGKGKEELE